MIHGSNLPIPENLEHPTSSIIGLSDNTMQIEHFRRHLDSIVSSFYSWPLALAAVRHSADEKDGYSLDPVRRTQLRLLYASPVGQGAAVWLVQEVSSIK